MILGYPLSCPIGDTDDLVQLEAATIKFGVISCFAFARTGYGGFNWALFCDGLFNRYIQLKEGVIDRFDVVPFDMNKEKHSLTLESIGNWEEIPAGTAVGLIHVEFEEAHGDSVLALITANQNYLVSGDLNSSFSSWVLTGLRRGFNVSQGVHKTRGTLQISLTQSGGVNTLTLTAGGVIQASGSRTGNGSITLAEQNDSGVSGSVTIAYVSDVAALLHIRWPKSYSAEIDSQTAEIDDNGVSNKFEARIRGVSNGTHNLTITPISDTGVSHTPTVVSSVVVANPPAPPTALRLQNLPSDYLATHIEWAASADADTYNVYDSDLNEPTDILNVIANQAGITYTLPAITQAAGIRRVIVEALKSGVESGERFCLEIEYDSIGVIIKPRPSAPDFTIRPTTSGLTVNFDYRYSRRLEQGNATKLAVFLVSEANFAAFDGSGVADKEIALSADDLINGADTVIASITGVWNLFIFGENATGERSIIQSGVRLWLDSDAESAVPASAEVGV